jgi:hypothetical protein
MTHRQTSLRPEQGGKFHAPVGPTTANAGLTEGDRQASFRRALERVPARAEKTDSPPDMLDRLIAVGKRAGLLLLKTEPTVSLTSTFIYVDMRMLLAACMPLSVVQHIGGISDDELDAILAQSLIPEGQRVPYVSFDALSKQFANAVQERGVTFEELQEGWGLSTIIDLVFQKGVDQGLAEVDTRQRLQHLAKDLHIELDRGMTWEAALERLYDEGVKRGRASRAEAVVQTGPNALEVRTLTGAQAAIAAQVFPPDAADGGRAAGADGATPGDVAVNINGKKTFTKAPTRFVRPLKDIAATIEEAKREGKKSVSVAWLEKVYAYMTE